MELHKTFGIVVLVATSLLLTVVACGKTSVSPTPTSASLVNTEDIDAIYDPVNQRLDAASFVPGVPREEVVQRALEGAGRVLGTTDTSTLETRATVGLYTGTDNGGNQVEERRVWLVVVDDLPITFPSGPPRSSVDRSGQRQQNQLVVFFDADTGEEVEGSISGRWVEE